MKNNGNIPLYCCLAVLLSGFSLIVMSQCQTAPIKPSSPIEREYHLRTPADFEPSPKPIIVAVIDTGFDFKSDWTAVLKAYPKLRKPRLCKFGHKTFTGKDLTDNHGHGTHIAGTIAQWADNSNYCIVVIKYFDPTVENPNLVEQTRLAFEYAMNIKADIINYSAGGEDRSEVECQLMKKILDAGIVIVAAAGNESKNVNDVPYYPAMCDTRIRMIANVYSTGEYVQTSNITDNGPKSRHMYSEVGYNLMNLAPNNQLRVMTGTSQATAVHTGKIIKDWNKH
jgi:major intracellular serine protease